MATKRKTKKRATKKIKRRVKKKAPAKKAKRRVKKTIRATKTKRTKKKHAAKRAAGSVVKLGPTPKGGSDREQIIKVIQACTGVPKLAANNTLNALLSTIGLSIARNKQFQLVGFGKFRVSKRKARWGVNPATGQRIRIKASKSVRFKPASTLKGSL